jgi:hypothetical protein
MYVIAAKRRALITFDLDGSLCSLPVLSKIFIIIFIVTTNANFHFPQIKVFSSKSEEVMKLTTPCLLPSFDSISVFFFFYSSLFLYLILRYINSE